MKKPVDFIIMGVQKCGTTAAKHNLNHHPKIRVIIEEPDFFDDNWNKGLEWYVDFLGNGDKPVVGEGSPKTLLHTNCHQRIRKLFPDVKLIVLLRNPIYRAYSQWRMIERLGIGKSGCFLERFLKDNRDMSRLGHYGDQISKLFQVFPRTHVHVVISEHLLKDMHGGYNKMVEFLGLEKYDPPCFKRNVGNHADVRRNAPNKGRISYRDWKFLYDYYRPRNEELFELLGYDVPEWSNCDHLIV